MKTLNEHNQQKMDEHNALQKTMEPHANGIACPECGKELWDTNPMLSLSTFPPKTDIHCPACGYSGYRYV